MSISMDEKVNELERIRLDNHGLLKPEIVVDESRPEEAVLHPCFDWVDESAAEKYRIHQARNLIKSVRITKTKDDGTVTAKRVYVNLGESEDNAQAYHAISDVVRNPEQRAQMIDQVWRELSAIKARYRELLQAVEDQDLLVISEIITRKEQEEAA